MTHEQHTNDSQQQPERGLVQEIHLVADGECHIYAQQWQSGKVSLCNFPMNAEASAYRDTFTFEIWLETPDARRALAYLLLDSLGE